MQSLDFDANNKIYKKKGTNMGIAIIITLKENEKKKEK